MSLEVGDLLFVTLRSNGADLPVTGWAVEVSEEDVILSTGVGILADTPHKFVAKAGDQEVGFVRVPASAATSSKPSGWKGPKTADLPSWGACKSAWKKVPQTRLESSDAEIPAQRAAPSSKTARLAKDLKGLDSLLGGDDLEDDEEDETEDDEEGTSYLAPGQSRPSGKRKEVKKGKGSGQELKELLQASLASGGDTKNLLTLYLVQQLVGQNKKKKKRSGASSSTLLGGSSSEDSGSDDDELSGRGMRAVSTLQKLHARILKRPKKVCELFEEEMIRELGVVPGQPWTVKDYLKKQSWGRFKGLYRTAVMDAAVYELLRSGKHEIAAAQVCQNLKAKMQAVLQGGDWDTAWLLTGLPDPLHHKEWAGSKEEMTIVSGYVEAITKLKKRIKDVHQASTAEDEEAPSGSRK